MAWLQWGLRRGTREGFWREEEERADPGPEEITSLFLSALAISSCALACVLLWIRPPSSRHDLVLLL